MPPQIKTASRSFADKPDFSYICPACKKGYLIPDQSTFKFTEPAFSKEAYGHEAWDPEWITYRFTVTCFCDRAHCGETSYVSGSGCVDQRYDYEGHIEHYNSFRIHTFYPAPQLIGIPENVPFEVEDLLSKSFSLYWVDISAAANALRAALEALLNELQVPNSRVNAEGKTVRIYLHHRLEIWGKTHKDYAELCLALKEVGNLGSHGETVRSSHYFGSLEIFQHVLTQLYENNAERMKELASKIRSEVSKS